MRSKRHGFTLIELLAVIMIITILVSLITVAVTGAMARARDAQARTEISQLESALANFKAKFGTYPPSYIKIYSTQAGWNGDPASKATIMGLWPQFNFASSSFPWSGSSKTLSGAECLAFFLGGVESGGALIGFSTDPANPFSATGNTRVGPFFEFKSDRLADTDGDGVHEYRDPVGTTGGVPYLYANGNEGRGYNAQHLVVYADDVTMPTSQDMVQVYKIASGMSSNSAQPQNRQSYQIICAGRDGLYGRGGMWKDGTKWSALVSQDNDISDKSAGLVLRQQEADNVVNFHGGPLGGN